MADTYRVTAPYVTVKVRTDKGVQAVGLYEGALLPEGTLDESIKHHLGKHHLGKPMIEKFQALGSVQAEPEPVEVHLPEDPAPEPEPEVETSAPPTAGPGSGQKAWAEYAVSLGYVRDDVAAMSRDEIIDLINRGDDADG